MPFNHVTGVGHVDAHVGLYDDCIRRKNTFLLLISEIFGGVNGRAVRFLTRLAHMAQSHSDDVYFDRAGREVPYFLHHASALSSAAAVGHGRVIQRHVADLRTRSAHLTPDLPGALPRAGPKSGCPLAVPTR